MRALEAVTQRDSQKFAEVCEELLSQGAAVRFRGEGPSMRPNILDQDALVVTPVGAAGVRRGEVVLTRSAAGWKAHRVVAADKFSVAVITRGDAGQENDPISDAVVGRVVAVERGGKEIATLGLVARSAARLNCAVLRVKMGFWNRAARWLGYFFPAALLLFLCLIAGVAPAAAANADLAVTETANVSSATSGGSVIYTIMVSNNGPSGSKPVWTHTMPTGMSFTSLSPTTGWTCSGITSGSTASVVCTDNSNMASGGSTTFTLTVGVLGTATTATYLTDTTSVTSANGTTDPTAGNNSVMNSVLVTPAADLAITETPGSMTALQGGTISYTVVVTNNGPSAATTPVWTQTIPTGTTYNSGAAASGWTCTTPAAGATGTVTCTDGSNLANAGTATFTLVVNVPTTATVGSTVASSASVSSTTGDQNSANNTGTSATVTVAAGADLAITESPGSASVIQGGQITYTVVVTNNGPSAATTPAWTQSTPTNTTFASVTPPAGWTCTKPAVGATGTVTCTDGSNLANAGTGTFTLVVNVPTTVATGTVISSAATVSSTTGDPNAANNTGTSSNVTVAAGADLAITQTPGSASVIQGGTISYTVVVTNNGPSAATTPAWTQSTPTNTTFASVTPPAGWTCTKPAVGATGTVTCTDGSNLANAGTGTFTLVVTVPTTVAVGTVIGSSASVSSTTGDPNSANNTGTSSNVTVAAGADLATTETPGSGTVIQGGQITYTIVVTNNGPSAAAVPVLTQNTPTNTTFASVTPASGWTCTSPAVGATGAVTCTDGSNLANAGTGTFTLVVNVPTTVATGTTISGSAAVSSTTGDPNAANNTGTSSNVTVAAGADVAITETPGSGSAAAGGIITYTVTVTNNGPSTATAPVWTQATPTNTTFASVTAASGWTCTSPAVGATGTVTCTDGSNLANAGTAAFTLVVTVNGGTAVGTMISGSASVSSTTGDPSSANNTATSSVTIAAGADLATTLTANPTTIAPGGTVTYTVVVTNNGTASAAAPVMTIATPANTTFSSVTPASGWTCTNPGVGNTGNVTCTDGSNLANAGTATFTVKVLVASNASDLSTIAASANVTSTTPDQNAANNTATANVTVAAPADLGISQTAAAPVVAAGANVVYTVVVTNNGPNASQNVVFYENIPANTNFQSIGTAPTGWTCTTPAVGATGAINCKDASLANGGTATFTVTLQINSATAAETMIQNVASVTSNTTSDPVAANNTSTTTTLVGIVGDADLKLTLAANPNPVFVSSTLVYTVTVQNLGVADATAASITDTLPTTVTYVSATATQGTCSQSAGVVTCTLGTLTAGNTATATITVTAAGTSSSLSNTASTTSTVTDPFTANNSATIVTFVQPQSCGNPARDGAGGTLTGNVNTYFAPSGAVVLSPGATGVTLGAGFGSNTPIAVGDLLMLIQMQDAAINSTNTGAYGDGTAGDPATGYSNANNAGRYEFVTATNAVSTSGGALTFSGAGPNGGALSTYTQAAYAAGSMGQRAFEVIRVPQYSSATLSSGLAALAWNGSVGGVLAIDVAGQLTLGGTVSADAVGFRGGAGRQLKGGTGASQTDYVTLASFAANGSKGEGIAGTPQYVANAGLSAVINSGVEGYPNGSYARGAPGNAGGGGTDADPPANDENSGGGGGGNGSGGGNGGYAWNTSSLGNGFGGSPYPGAVSNLIMGGGGGAGTTNDGTSDPTNGNPAGINSSGAAGGGIVIIHAGTVVGTGTITANGQNALSVQNDGAGGGGAGGAIELLALSGGIAGATLNANGGNGGSTWATNGPGGTYPGNRHGPGGGGGGGVIFTTSSPAAANVAPGVNGTSTTVHDSYGATPGLGNGIVTTNLGTSGFTQTPGNRPGAQCSVADLVVTNAGTPNPVLPGGNITYTQTVNNNGPQMALNLVFSEAIPSNTTFQSLSVPGSWSCTTPAVGGTGNISCTLPTNNVNALSSFSLVVQVGAGVVSGTTITDTDSVSSSVNDNNLANNTATVNTLVATPASADIAVTNSAAPSTVAAGSNLTYTQSLINNGPATATNVKFTEAVPTGTTFVSFTGAAGWTCVTPAGSVTCTIASLASGVSGAFSLVVLVPTGTATGTMISDTDMGSSSVTDPNLANNSATVTNVTVAQPGQADMAVTMTGTPNPVLAGANITYTAVVTNNGPAAATTVTAVDTIPANTTFVSDVVPSGWTCTTNSTTVSCTNPSQAVNASSTFTFVFMVTAGTAPNTVITNSITVGSAVSDPTAVNNTATVMTTVTSPTQADLSITKTGSPDPVNQGDTLVYIITVSNNGPASALSVVMTDTLPTAVTYVSSSATQGTCSQATGTVTCPIGTMSNGQIVTITINVTATTMSTSSYAVNSASVSSSTSDPDSANNTATFTSTIAAPNVVQLVYLDARPRSVSAGGQRGVVLEWRTREEIRNLGFNVYREDALGRHRVNPSIIAGAALFVRGGRPQHGAKTYQWIDPAGTAESSYVLEDVDLNGTRTEHGPVSVDAVLGGASNSQSGKHAASRASNSVLLAQLNQVSAAVAGSTAGLGRTVPGAAAGRMVNTPRPTLQKILPGEFQAQLDGVAAVKIGVRSEGWYRVTGAALVAAGLDAGTDARLLQLYAEGIEQPLLISGRGVGPLGPADTIAFYGTGIDTPYSDTRVYWLVKGTHAGKRIAAVEAASSGTSDESQGFPFTVVRQDRTTYFATLLNGEDNDNFFGATVTSQPVEQVLTVANHAANSALAVSADITLQGATDGQAHRVAVTFNGASIGELDFTGQVNVTNTLAIDSSLLVEGANTFTLTALNGDNDVSLLQSIALHYAHAYTADGNWLSATANAGSSVHIGGFTSAAIHVLDVTDPLAITQIDGAVKLEGSTYGVSFGVRSGAPAGHTLLAFTDDQISAAASLTYHAPSILAARGQRADLIYIAYPDFVESLTPLKQLRETQKQVVSIVTVDQLFDAFNYGERSPYAIKEFLLYAAAQAQKPQGILFVGDASLDPRDYLGFGYLDLVPTRIIETAAFKTASDDWFTDFQSNGFATIPTGRLPVRTVAEAALTVQKIVDYENGSYAGTWNGQALVVADQNEGSDFSTNAQNAAATLQPLLAVNTILANGQDPDMVRQQILAGLNSGALIVNYNGHGSTEQWSFTDLLDDNSAGALTNGQKLPVYLLMDCLNGFFHDVYTQSLAESLLLAPNGGAVAVWASSGFTDAQPQSGLNQALLNNLAADQSTSLGAAILAAKLGVTDPDVRRTWILFGDPMMKLHFNGAAAGLAPSRIPPARRAGAVGPRVRTRPGSSLPN
jgi:uncharacterized repeat protein (TIGR01451 family)